MNWCLGRLAKKFKNKGWFPVSEYKLLQGEKFHRKYVRFSLLLSRVPFIGDPITIVAGVLREPLWLFVSLVSIAKCSGYFFVVPAGEVVFLGNQKMGPAVDLSPLIILSGSAIN